MPTLERQTERWTDENHYRTGGPARPHYFATLPKTLREAYGIRPGDTMTLLDLDGVFVLSPRRSEVDAIADKPVTEW